MKFNIQLKGKLSISFRSRGPHYWACSCMEPKENQWHGTESVKMIHSGHNVSIYAILHSVYVD